MTTGTQSGTDDESESAPEPEFPDRPTVSVCESCPGRTVFMESDNTDGWIASDLTVEPTQ
ncbi:hypothetical protein ACOZ4L_07200 [Haloplanus ruber]|uniref:Uncharacterized protein n=1 Tax=Haloplanus ruber TaxID=869892 RepID=A0ABD6CV96_9EURY|nr:hypothetical protein [Haloplanus ruber]